MKYTFEISGNYVKVSNYDTTEVIYIIPTNLITFKKLSATEFSFNVAGENLYTIITWTDVMIPDNSSFANIDDFLVEMSSIVASPSGLTIGQALNISSAMQ